MKAQRRILLTAALATLCLGTQAQKLSPSTSVLAMEYENGKALAAKGMGDNSQTAASASGSTLSTFIHITDDKAISQIEALGGKVHARYGTGIVTATLPMESLRQLAGIEGVSYVQAAHKVHLTMDVAREEAGVDLAHGETNSPGFYTGEGVIVGVVDQGLEYGHVAFYETDHSALRIKRVWNQNGTGNAPEGFDYGTELTTEQEILAAQTDTRSTYHGSHVTNIAAGGDLGSRYYGVAHDADIVFVSCAGSSTNVVDAVKYIFDYADKVDMPCVVNLSLGLHVGPHDGTSAIDRAFDEMAGPGRIIVGAAGNEGQDNLHVTKTFTENDTILKTMGLFTQSGNTNYSVADVWGSPGTNFKIKVVVVNSIKGNIVCELDEVSTEGEIREINIDFPSSSGVTGTLTMAAYVDPDNNRPNAVLNNKITSIPSTHRIGYVVTGEPGNEIHMWDPYMVGFTNASKPGWTNGSTTTTVGEIGGTGKSVISVGAYCTKISDTSISGDICEMNTATTGTVGERCPFTSHGPTVDGRMKPDVCAPGAGIVSAVSKLYSGFSRGYNTVIGQTTYDNNDYFYEINAGTSMASPFVAGTVAIWLQANPDLAPEDVRKIIASTSRHDMYTGAATADDNLWGYGKISAYDGLVEALTYTGIEEIGTDQPLFRIETDRAGRSATVSLPSDQSRASVTLYNAAGVPVASFAEVGNGQKLSFGALPSGVYVLKMSLGGTVQTIKTMY